MAAVEYVPDLAFVGRNVVAGSGACKVVVHTGFCKAMKIGMLRNRNNNHRAGCPYP